MVYDSIPPGYEVEFTDAHGATIAILTLHDDDLAPADLDNQRSHTQSNR